MTINRPEGTSDQYGIDMDFLSEFYSLATSTFEGEGYSRIETPIFEQTDLFVRGLGDSSDVVNKEMYSALSGGNLKKIQSGESISSKSKLTLRPEGTAGVVRAVIQNNLVEAKSQPGKFFYVGPMFRAERPQKGRMRQFYQAGCECIGSSDPFLDARMIKIASDFIINFCGIEKESLTLHLNSIGCETCRSRYRENLKAYLKEHESELCETCKSRIDLNPLRAFDCKNEECKSTMQNAPKITDHLCEDCSRHFSKVKEYLDTSFTKYTVDPSLVRGLDYYTRTVFEFTFDDGMGSQNALAGGGRYDKLIEELGGKSMPALGFAAGFERMKLAALSANKTPSKDTKKKYFLVSLCPQAREIAKQMIIENASSDITLDMDFREGDEGKSDEVRSAKSQLKLANKLEADIAIIIGEDEIEDKKATVRDMNTHEEKLVDFQTIFEN